MAQSSAPKQSESQRTIAVGASSGWENKMKQVLQSMLTGAISSSGVSDAISNQVQSAIQELAQKAGNISDAQRDAIVRRSENSTPQNVFDGVKSDSVQPQSMVQSQQAADAGAMQRARRQSPVSDSMQSSGGSSYPQQPDVEDILADSEEEQDISENEDGSEEESETDNADPNGESEDEPQEAGDATTGEEEPSSPQEQDPNAANPSASGAAASPAQTPQGAPGPDASLSEMPSISGETPSEQEGAAGDQADAGAEEDAGDDGVPDISQVSPNMGGGMSDGGEASPEQNAADLQQQKNAAKGKEKKDKKEEGEGKTDKLPGKKHSMNFWPGSQYSLDVAFSLYRPAMIFGVIPGLVIVGWIYFHYILYYTKIMRRIPLIDKPIEEPLPRHTVQLIDSFLFTVLVIIVVATALAIVMIIFQIYESGTSLQLRQLSQYWSIIKDLPIATTILDLL